MTTTRMFLHNDTRLMMLRHRRRVFLRRFFGGVALVVSYGWIVYYFGG